ncbi:MAG TPA: tRNA uridine-5-carboxymethylaminomethyl(34) synthesis GTPase MnmE [Clostridiales bacterium]|nr:tRNA uridine-5-carboxymethylaminomethyl(34) synthesis GTPase MnmE [Clostridiales bacterium]
MRDRSDSARAMPGRNAETIAAISTPYGTGGIGIIRISGPEAFSVAEKIFRGRRKISETRSHSVVHGRIVDPADGQMVDEVLLVKMDAPGTFTGEDTIEINCHGGIVVLRRVLSLVLRYGARAACPGEFTKRAFINGRMDLAQAEAVIDLINSKTDEGSRAAAAQLQGRLSEKIRGARRKMIELIARIEAAIEYPEEDIEEITGEAVRNGIKEVREELRKTAQSFTRGRLLREGITAAIIGKPNAGKSSLLNALVGSSRAIVTDIPGTTRDIIEEYVNIKGIPVRFLDTAGIRSTDDPVEAIGVEKARTAAAEAELVIIVLDAQTGITDEDREIMKTSLSKKTIVMINKTDVADDRMVEDMKEQIRTYGDIPVVVASMVDGTGMDDLADRIESLAAGGEISANNEVLLTNARHRQLIEDAVLGLDSAESAYKGGMPLDLVTIDIRDAAEALGRITGESVSEDVVNEIFSRFCVGK